ncbi:hypothetical protein ABBQ38_009372 [Trebouxia sp. C0009 RCD-2024]
MQTLHLQHSAAHRNTQDCSCSHQPASSINVPRTTPSLKTLKQLQGRQLGTTRHVVAHAVATEDEEDLIQFQGREKWYEAKFCADDAPDWNPAVFLRKEQNTPGLQTVVLEIEISRDRVPIRNAYKHVGQQASVRVNSGMDRSLSVCSAPFPLLKIKEALYKVRGDLYAGAMKLHEDTLSTTAELELLVDEKDGEEIWNLTEGDSIEVGPFRGTGMNLRSPIQGMFAYPTLVLFCEGKAGIAAAKALIEATPDSGGLNFPLRQDVRMYYRAPNQEAFCFQNLYSKWEQDHRCKVITSTRSTFMDMFDDDDTLMYEPALTAAVIMTGDDEEAEKAALEVCKEAEITEIARQTQEMPATDYLTVVQKDMTGDFTTKLPDKKK